MTARESERSFDLFGSRVRLLAGVPRGPGLPSPELALAEGEAALRALHRRLSRFRPDSELSRLNADPREVVPVSASLAAFVAVAIESARRSGGLVDPTILGRLEEAGYGSSRIGSPAADLSSALAAAPPRSPAMPDPGRRWAEVLADPAAATVRRPPGVRIDSGGIAKGYAADLVARRLAGYSSFCVDCGGDLRVGGADGLEREIIVPSPFHPVRGLRLTMSAGGIATSGINKGLWRHGDGFANHLIDPASGAAAWTGLVQATAAAGTAVEAEIRAKAALLSGPDRAPKLLPDGGVLVGEDGEFEFVGARELPHEVAA